MCTTEYSVYRLRYLYVYASKSKPLNHFDTYRIQLIVNVSLENHRMSVKSLLVYHHAWRVSVFVYDFCTCRMYRLLNLNTKLALLFHIFLKNFIWIVYIQYSLYFTRKNTVVAYKLLFENTFFPRFFCFLKFIWFNNKYEFPYFIEYPLI